MKFLNVDPFFNSYQTLDVGFEFYYKGEFDRSVSSIVEDLKEGRFPTNLKGNFAFFFKDSQRAVFAVDHLPTYNMFWREGEVSHIFYELKKEGDTVDPIMIEQRKLLFGGTVGPKTIFKEIKRLEAGTYFEKNLITGEENVLEYIDIDTHHIDKNIDVEDISKIVESSIEKYTRDPFSLLWSSGTDSNCIYGFIRKLKREENCTLVSLYSSVATSDEKPQIEELEKSYGIKTIFYDLGAHTGLTDEVRQRYHDNDQCKDYKTNYLRFWDGFWWEPNLFQKYTAISDLGFSNNPILTGEAGDQQFGSRYAKMVLNLVTQIPHCSAKDISNLFLCLEVFSHRKKWYSPRNEWAKFLETNPYIEQAWEEVRSWIEKTWNKIDSGGDNINCSEILLNRLKTSRLLYGYTQLKGINFLHPLADYRLYHSIYKTPGTWKIQQGKTRRISKEIIKDYVDPRPWSWTKSGIEVSFVPMSRNIHP
jgi:hypothetical protein